MTNQPQELHDGSVIGLFVPLEENQIRGSGSVEQCIGISGRQGKSGCPECMHTLLSQALNICSTPEEESKACHLLTADGDVFSSNKTDAGRTNLVGHQIPADPGITLLRQPPRRLGPQKR